MFVFLLPTWPAVSQRPRVIVRLVSLWSTWSTQMYFYIRKLIMLCDSHRHLSLIIVKHRWHVLVREHILCVNNQKTGFTCKGLSCCLFINIWTIATPNWAWVERSASCTSVPGFRPYCWFFLPPLSISFFSFIFFFPLLPIPSYSTFSLYLFLLS